jgi:hypothetical protein
MRSLASSQALVVALVLAAGAARADEVILTNGRRLTGTARVAPDGTVEVHSAAGSVGLPAHLVARIERSETFEQRVAAVRAALPKGDAEALFQLASWCAAEGASTLARRLYREVLILDPDHAGARRALGFRRFENRWVSDEEYHALKGEVLYRGAWRPAVEVDRLLARETALAQLAAERQREAAWRALEAAGEARLETELARQASLAYEPFYPYPYGFYPGPVVVVPPIVKRPPSKEPPRSPGMGPRPTPAPHRPGRHERSGRAPASSPGGSASRLRSGGPGGR